MVAMPAPAPTRRTQVFLHNRRGLRIELDLDAKLLEIWVSPGAGRDADAGLRNFSNRDDHTRVFDRIGLEWQGDFKGCDWDPYHAALRLGDDVLHLATLDDRPVVLVWSERGTAVELKTDKAAHPVRREPRLLQVHLSDRGQELLMAAAVGPGAGGIRHQIALEPGRSIYARCELAANQPLAISCETCDQPVRSWAEVAAGSDPLAQANEAVAAADVATAPGRPELVRLDGLQQVLELNRRVLHACSDASGAIRAAIQRIYYMIWVRDGGFVNAYRAYAGEAAPIADWCAYLLPQPTEVDEPGVPKGRMFGQLVNRRINKLEEDGTFFAAWSAFTHWTQTGDETHVRGRARSALVDSQDWLEAYCRREGRIGLTRRYYCETPFTGARDNGYDNAIGLVDAPRDTRWQGTVVTEADDLYINAIAYATCRMLEASSATVGEADAWAARAEPLRRRLGQLRGDGPLPSYGEVHAADGRWLATPPYALDREDFVWALSAAPFTYPQFDLNRIRRQLLDDCLAKPKHWFVCSYGALLAACDTAWEDEERIVQALEYVRPQCERPGRWLPMPGSVVELVDMEDGNIWHDIRPQMFSISALLAAVSNLGLRRLPFALAVRPTRRIARMRDYQWHGGHLTLSWAGAGTSIAGLRIDGQAVAGTWLLPESRLGPGRHRIEVALGEPAPGPTLIAGTVRLEEAAAGCWALTAFGHNEAVLRACPGEPRLVDAGGRAITATVTRQGDDVAVAWNGRGRCTLTA
jgi:hypothetical protein